MIVIFFFLYIFVYVFLFLEYLRKGYENFGSRSFYFKSSSLSFLRLRGGEGRGKEESEDENGATITQYPNVVESFPGDRAVDPAGPTEVPRDDFVKGSSIPRESILYYLPQGEMEL